MSLHGTSKTISGSGPGQHGFTKGRSCLNNLIFIVLGSPKCYCIPYRSVPKIVTISLRPCNAARNETVGQGVPRDFKSWSMQGALSLLLFWLSLSLKAEAPFCGLFTGSFWPLEGVKAGFWTHKSGNSRSCISLSKTVSE